MLNDDELESLLAEIESDRVERKRSASDENKIRQTICAFANDLPEHGDPGVIFIGVNDDGTCAGLTIDDQLLKLLAQMRADGSILPQPTMTVQKRIIHGCELVVVIIQPADNPPVRYKGRVWVRVGPTLSQATPEDERRLSEKRRAKDVSFDLRPVQGALLNDLDLDFFKKTYLPAAVAEDILEQNQRGIEQQLISLRFLTQKQIPAYGGILVLSKDPLCFLPGAYVQFVRFDGLTLTDPILDSKPPISGPIFDVLRQINEIINLNITSQVDITSAPREIRKPDYPASALRQLIYNAIMHRNYEGTNAPIRVNWFSDRVEIMNPGGLYGQVNQQNLGQGVTDYRNPFLAEAMRVLGFVQRFGIGIPIARAELEKNGNPPMEFRIESGYFLVTVRRRL